jgi:FkbM family methyltransferase
MMTLNRQQAREYLSHLILGTPLEAIATTLRRILVWQRQSRSPHLKEILSEVLTMPKVIRRIIETAPPGESINCIDVGCHLGLMLQTIVRLSPNGKHLAIEPVPYKAAWLQQKFPKVEVRQVALSDRAGTAEFFMQTASSAFSGLRFQDQGKAGVEKVTVQCERLDDIVPSDRQVTFIKLDAEGGELDVLRSSIELLQRCRPVIMFTCTTSATTAFEVDPKDIFAFLQQQEYQIYTMHEWFDGRSPLTVEQFIQAMHFPFQAFRFLAVPNQ